jgi:hypothetical protein
VNSSLLSRVPLVLVALAPTALVQGSDEPGPTDIRPLTVNTANLEYAPTITADGRTLYFCSDRPGGVGGHDIWRAMIDHKDGIDRGEPVNAGIEVNTVRNEGVASITADGAKIYFTGCRRADAVGDCDLYVADLVDGEFRNVRNLRVLNSPFWDTQPTVSADGSTICFVSNRPGCTGPTGDVDIFISTLQPDGSWSAPRNMGAPINTSEREDSPFLHSGGDLLYYSTRGYPGLGGLDFVVSHRTDSGWSVPRNLGAPLNTEKDERFITVPASGRRIYFSSERTDLLNRGMLDIFVAAVASPEAPHRSATLALLAAPNPAVDEIVFTLLTESSSDADHQLIVTDLSGREVARRSFTGERLVLPLNGYSAGMYFARIDGRIARFVVAK